MKRFLLYLITGLLICKGYSQVGVDSIIRQVDRNNKAIASSNKFQQAKAAEYKTGLTPYDPFVEYDYMYGSPAGAGNQRDFSVSQRFDFPTSYKRKRELSGNQVIQTNLQQQVFRQDVLLEAKQAALHLIYLNKKIEELRRRLRSTEGLVKDIQQKLDKGDITILDMNKAKLQLLTIKSDLELSENEKSVRLARLIELNGGEDISINDTSYPIMTTVPPFDELDSLIEANDPIIKMYEQDKLIQTNQLYVQKAMNLPKLEAGYHSQGILGQSYRGFHVGLSVPLWENKNRVNAAKANIDYATSAAEAHRIEHRQDNRQAYEQLGIRTKIMAEHAALLSSLNNTYLLNKSLSLGQITVVQYFYEVSFYFTAYDKYLQTELEYHQALARLYKFQL